MRIPVKSLLIIFISCTEITSGSIKPGDISVTSDTIERYMSSETFTKSDFVELWKKFEEANQSAPDWRNQKNAILKHTITFGSPDRFRALVQIEENSSNRSLAFDPTAALYSVITDASVADEPKAKMIRVCLELGALPTLSHEDTTAAEILLQQNKASLLTVLLNDPSPIHYAVLEEMTKRDAKIQRGIEVYRTRLIREMNGKKDVSVDVRTAILNSHYYDFADHYLQSEMYLVGFLVVVVMLIQFLYQLRIKRIPINSKLMIPRNVGEPNIWWPALQYALSTVTTSLPTSNLFECIGLAIATFGGIVWSEVYTGRRDVAITISVAVVAQSLWTVTAYYLYAPTNDTDDSDKYEEEIDPSSHLYRVMFYPKSKDVSLALTNTAIYLLACSVSVMILFVALDPLNKMYTSSHDLSISDTYGLNRSLTRAVAIAWDSIIFFVISLRVYRAIDTVNVFFALRRDHKRLPS
jgi:hypothetical protein